jgi:hypothetical protein
VAFQVDICFRLRIDAHDPYNETFGAGPTSFWHAVAEHLGGACLLLRYDAVFAADLARDACCIRFCPECRIGKLQLQPACIKVRIVGGAAGPGREHVYAQE